MTAERDGGVTPVELRTNDDSGLVTTAFSRPALRWRLNTTRPAVRQIAYEIQRSADSAFSATHSSGRVAASRPFGAEWPGPAVRSREVVWTRVRVWTDEGLTDWSTPLRVEGGLFEPSDWIARPISPNFNVGRAEPAPVPLLRRSFTVHGEIASARLYVTALGLHDVSINGRPVSADLLDPGWTDYRHRLLYAAHDVTSLLHVGENVLSAMIGDGWWRGNLTWMERRAVYGDTTALLAQLEITFADGTRQLIATDQDWRGSTGGWQSADLYDGCDYDLDCEPVAWREPGFDATGWSPVADLPLPSGLEQRSMPAVREVKTFGAALKYLSSCRIAIDCGQNLTGYLRLTLRARGDATVTVRHAEVLEPDGNLHTAALRTARATDTYRLTPGLITIAPVFTYHGFRYAEITLDGEVEVERAEVCVISSDLREVGRFHCSDARINQLFSNIRWSQRGNFVALPTDCPQRDERLGWTGDIQVFAPTACTNFDARTFLSSWLVDLGLEQAADGQVPSTVPNVIQGHPFEFGGIGWADAATLVPWAIYEAYGDKTVLARQFASMKAWVDWAASRLNSENIWLGDFHLGDWLDPGAPPDKPEEATTDRHFIASAYLALSARTVARSAEVLADPVVAEHYHDLSRRVAAATWRHWREQAATTQTGCAIAIVFGIVPDDELANLGLCLADLVEQAGGRIATGFLGTPIVLPALTSSGQHDAAFRLLLNEHAPGWLYQVTNGATTMWERWDAILPGGQIHGGAMAAGDADSMTSFNHYAYGSVGAWLYRSLAGIAPDDSAPGYELIQFRPQPGGQITAADATIKTPFGDAGISWSIDAESLAVQLDVPPGARGRFAVPEGWALENRNQFINLSSGHHRTVLSQIPIEKFD
jgi:alpha-L-rhamnosidase